MCTALAGFENGTVTPDTRINDSGTLSLDHGESKVNDADKRGMGMLPFEDIVAYSRNVGAARVAIALADSTRNASAILHKTWMDLGFGARTGIDLAGEAPGIMRDPTIRPWSQVDLANGSFGQGVAVTPIQLATAYSAMVNGGTLPTPHVVLSIGNQPVDVAQKGRIMSTEMSAQMVELMSHVLHTVPWYKANTLTPGLRWVARPVPRRSGTRRRTTARAPGRRRITIRSSATSARAGRSSSSRSRSARRSRTASPRATCR